MKKLLIIVTVCLLTFLFVDTIFAQDRPNILWITLEDTSPQFIGCYGNKDAKTPNIDKLASNGVRFTSAFSTGTVCSASRSTIITGVRTEKMGTSHHRSSFPIPEFIKGFPTYLKQVGYYTSNNSKTDYNTSNAKTIIKNSWNESSGKAGWWKRKEGQSFFSVFNYMQCHQSRTMTWSYKKYEKDVLNKLAPDEVIADNEFEMPTFYKDSPPMRKQMARVYNALKSTDNMIGSLLKRLEEDGLKDNTIIFCYADHGEGIPRGKSNAIGLGYRVPFIVWFPEKYQHLNPWGKGVVSDELISFEDLAPTLLSLTGCKIPEYMEGRPMLGEQRKAPREYIYGSRNRSGESMGLSRSVSNGKYMYTRVFVPQFPVMRHHKYFDVGDICKQMRADYKEGKLNEIQSKLFEQRPLEYLYDLENDKWETHNLASDSKYQKIKSQLKKALYKDIRKNKDIHFAPEYELVRISEKGTPFNYREDKKQYPFNKVLQAADLVGKGESVIKKQIKLLKHKDPIVRYWASVGIHVQAQKAKSNKEEILKSLNDSYPCVQVEIAAWAWEVFKDEKAKEVLLRHLSGDSGYVSWQVLHNLLYMDEDAKAFVEDVKELQKYNKSNKKAPTNLSIVKGCIDLFLHIHEGRELIY